MVKLSLCQDKCYVRDKGFIYCELFLNHKGDHEHTEVTSWE
mgnify:CR=1 FL=1|jgi:hypothetical protein